MSRPTYKSSIPDNATEVVERKHRNRARKSASYFVNGEKVGYREWSREGQLEFEYAERGGVKHGHEYSFYPNGQMLEKETCRDGYLHGVGRQWAEDGHLLVTWKLVRNVGLDLWCDTESGGSGIHKEDCGEGSLAKSSATSELQRGSTSALAKVTPCFLSTVPRRTGLRGNYQPIYVGDVSAARWAKEFRPCQADVQQKGHGLTLWKKHLSPVIP